MYPHWLQNQIQNEAKSFSGESASPDLAAARAQFADNILKDLASTNLGYSRTSPGDALASGDPYAHIAKAEKLEMAGKISEARKEFVLAKQLAKNEVRKDPESKLFDDRAHAAFEGDIHKKYVLNKHVEAVRRDYQLSLDTYANVCLKKGAFEVRRHCFESAKKDLAEALKVDPAVRQRADFQDLKNGAYTNDNLESFKETISDGAAFAGGLVSAWVLREQPLTGLVVAPLAGALLKPGTNFVVGANSHDLPTNMRNGALAGFAAWTGSSLQKLGSDWLEGKLAARVGQKVAACLGDVCDPAKVAALKLPTVQAVRAATRSLIADLNPSAHKAIIDQANAHLSELGAFSLKNFLTKSTVNIGSMVASSFVYRLPREWDKVGKVDLDTGKVWQPQDAWEHVKQDIITDEGTVNLGLFWAQQFSVVGPLAFNFALQYPTIKDGIDANGKYRQSLSEHKRFHDADFYKKFAIP